MEQQGRVRQATKSRPTLIDRQRLRGAFVRGEGSLLGLCREHGVSYGTARQWSKAEHWPELREKAAAKRLASLRADVEPVQAPAPRPAPEPLPAGDLAGKIEVLEKQITNADTLIATAPDHKAFLNLTKAKGELLRHYYHLRGLPGPGNRRPGKESKREVQPEVQPVE